MGETRAVGSGRQGPRPDCGAMEGAAGCFDEHSAEIGPCSSGGLPPAGSVCAQGAPPHRAGQARGSSAPRTRRGCLGASETPISSWLTDQDSKDSTRVLVPWFSDCIVRGPRFIKIKTIHPVTIAVLPRIAGWVERSAAEHCDPADLVPSPALQGSRRRGRGGRETVGP